MKERSSKAISQMNLTQGNPLKLILLFSIPIFFGQLFQIGYSLIDTKIVGSLLGEEALASVGSVTTLSNLLTQFFNGLTMGFSVLIARFYGENNQGRLKNALAISWILGIGITLVLSLLIIGCMNPILGFLNVPQAQYQRAYSYILILTAGMVVTTAYNMCANCMRAVGDAMTPLVFLIISSLLNIVLDYSFIHFLGLDVAGAAYATVLAQIISVLLCFLRIAKAMPILHPGLRQMSWEKDQVLELLKGGLSMGFMSSLVNFGTLLLQTGINTLGQSIIVAHTAARKFFEILLLPVTVIASAMATYSGQNYGAKAYDRIRKGILSALEICGLWCLLVLVITFTLSGQVISFIASSSNAEILHWGSLYMKLNMPFMIVCVLICVLRNAMQGFGDHITPLVSSGVELAGKAFFTLVLIGPFGYWAIIWAEPVVWFLMVIPLVVQTLRNKEIWQDWQRGKKKRA